MRVINFQDSLGQGIDKNLNILINLIQTIHNSVNLKEIYKVALDSVVELENVDMAMVYLIDEGKYEVVLQGHRNLPEDYVRRAGRIPHPKGVTWKVINSGKIWNLKDIQKDSDIGPAGKDLRHHGALGIPIFLEGKAIGVIWFVSYKEHQFNEMEVDLLSSLGNQIALAIARAKYTEELIESQTLLKERNEKLSILSKISQVVQQSMGMEDLYETFLNVIQTLNFVDLMFVYLKEGKERKEAMLQIYYKSNEKFLNVIGKIRYLKGVSWEVIHRGQLNYYQNASDLPIQAAHIEKAFGRRAPFSVPIELHDQPLGAIHFFSVEGKPFGEQEMDFLLSLGNQLGTAIAKAKMLEEVRHCEESIRESEQRYHVLAEHRYDLICELRADGQFLFVSSKYRSMLGYDPGELVDRNFFENIHPDDQPAVMAEFGRAAKTLSSAQAVFRYRHKSGEWRWLESTGEPFRTVTGEIRGVIASRDITESKRVEEAILKAHKLRPSDNKVEQKIIKVGIVTISPLLQEGICKMLESEADIKVVDVISNYLEIIPATEQSGIDVLIVDTALPDMNVKEMVESILQMNVKTKVLLLLHNLDDELIIEAISLGCSGALTYRSNAEQFAKAIRSVKKEEIWADRRVITKVVTRLIPLRKGKVKLIKSLFTKREEEILELIIQGYGNKHTSKKLFMSENTLKSHLTRIFKKLSVNSRLELMSKLHGEVAWK